MYKSYDRTRKALLVLLILLLSLASTSVQTVTASNHTDFRGAVYELPETDTTPPVIDVWYGDHQVFGNLGIPQRWVNILGNVSDAESGVISLSYKLNGIGPQSLSIGPDSRRLVSPGDFNVELDINNLVEGVNTVEIQAVNGAWREATQTVNVEFHKNNTWPLPYTIDWSKVSNLQEAVQVVDGQWAWDANGIRTTQIGYDRILAIGDMNWTDYEVTVPITIHGIDESAFGSQISIGPGLGVNLRWLGHTNSPVLCEQPHCGWEPTGGSNWYEWKQNSPDILKIIAAPPSGSTTTSALQFSIGKTYWYKARVETVSGGSLYRCKVWEKGKPEPATWTVQRQTQSGNLANGSFLLVAHYVDATFGNISVVPTKATLTIKKAGSGTVLKDPDQTSYNYGDNVVLTAIPDFGWEFSGWSGGLSGIKNPETVTVFGDITITAMFSSNTHLVYIPVVLGSH